MIRKGFIVLLFVLSVSDIFSQLVVNDSFFVYIPGGYFFQGNNTGDEDEEPKRKIYVSEFYMSKLELTNSEYCRFLNEATLNKDSVYKYIKLKDELSANKCRIYSEADSFFVEKGYELYPVNFISWFGADAYCKFYGFRLPTEAEWEYAAKGGMHSWFRLVFKNYHMFSGSDTPEDVAWFCENSNQIIHPIAQKSPNELILYDLSGNVDEWCADWYHSDSYNSEFKKNPLGPEHGVFKVYRGGSWYNSEKMLSNTNRRAAKPESQKATIGFRVVKNTNN